MHSLQTNEFVGVSSGASALRVEISAAARSDAKVLLTGETGVGKEVVAHELHRRSRRSRAPFVTINCSGVPDTLLESEFFGHARGSFTGAVRDYPGLLRLADHGTVFLDEVGEMSLRMQALVLRFLETGELQTVGGSGLRHRVDVRVIAATNRDLGESVAHHTFREDLYYRLNVFPLHVPPLRDRIGDLPLLLDHFAQGFSAQYGVPVPEFAADAVSALTAYRWPGNVREVRNVVEQLVSRDVGSPIRRNQLPPAIAAAAVPAGTLAVSPPCSTHATPRAEAMLERLLVQKESFWTTVYPSFMWRDLTRDDVRHIVRHGLDLTRGSYRLLTTLFNMRDDDYKRFLSFLKQHDCHVPFQQFRQARAEVPPRRPATASA